MNLKELSEKLGLSQTTVSRALNGYPEVNEATRNRILEAAHTYNYRPNLRAKSLATGRTFAIGHIIPLSSQHEMVNVIFADFLAGAGEVYAGSGYHIRMSVVNDEQEAKAYEDIARNGSVDGVILHGPIEDDPRIPLLAEIGLPFVVHGRSTEVATPYSWLDVNNRRAVMRSIEHLLDLGHRRIGLINGLEDLDFASRRRQGYEDALTANGLTIETDLMFSDEMSEPNGHSAMSKMLGDKRPPTAVFASSIMPALGAQRAIRDHGLELGRDISLICFDDEISYMPNGGGEPVFTAARSSVRAAGRRCAELLLAKIDNPETPATNELWEAELVLGPSTGPAPR